MSGSAHSPGVDDHVARDNELSNDDLAAAFRTAMKSGWRAALKPYGTFSSVMLKPVMKFESEQEAIDWANKVVDQLETPTRPGGKAPLDEPFGRSGDSDHVTVGESDDRRSP